MRGKVPAGSVHAHRLIGWGKPRVTGAMGRVPACGGLRVLAASAPPPANCRFPRSPRGANSGTSILHAASDSANVASTAADPADGKGQRHIICSRKRHDSRACPLRNGVWFCRIDRASRAQGAGRMAGRARISLRSSRHGDPANRVTLADQIPRRCPVSGARGRDCALSICALRAAHQLRF
jgi:hypothetical protein